MYFKKYADNDYEAVCDFLIELNARDTSHINWNWARFEWMYEHPEFNKDLIESIGLWIDDGNVVGAAIYAGASGNTDTAVEALIAGTLDASGEANCDHHDHEHGEGHSCGHGGCTTK